MHKILNVLFVLSLMNSNLVLCSSDYEQKLKQEEERRLQQMAEYYRQREEEERRRAEEQRRADEDARRQTELAWSYLRHSAKK